MEQVKDLPFNHYTWLTTHNSFARLGAKSATGSVILAPTNQQDSITSQLNVRYLTAFPFLLRYCCFFLLFGLWNIREKSKVELGKGNLTILYRLLGGIAVSLIVPLVENYISFWMFGSPALKANLFCCSLSVTGKTKSPFVFPYFNPNLLPFAHIFGIKSKLKSWRNKKQWMLKLVNTSKIGNWHLMGLMLC